MGSILKLYSQLQQIITMLWWRIGRYLFVPLLLKWGVLTLPNSKLKTALVFAFGEYCLSCRQTSNPHRVLESLGAPYRHRRIKISKSKCAANYEYAPDSFNVELIILHVPFKCYRLFCNKNCHVKSLNNSKISQRIQPHFFTLPSHCIAHLILPYISYKIEAD